MATPLQIRAMTTAKPFKPFLVHMASGETFTIRHPENIACSTNGRDVVIFDGEAMAHVEGLLIEVMTPVPPEPTPPGHPRGNGA